MNRASQTFIVKINKEVSSFSSKSALEKEIFIGILLADFVD